MKLKKGFTLIEILVIVVIIGILAAVAVPEYQAAVERSRFSTMLPIMKSILEAQNRFYLETGERVADVDIMDLNLPYSSKELRDPDSTSDSVVRYVYRFDSFPGTMTVANRAIFLTNSMSGYTVDYFGRPRHDSIYDLEGATGLCYSCNAKGERICKAFGDDTGQTNENGCKVYKLDL